MATPFTRYALLLVVAMSMAIAVQAQSKPLQRAKAAGSILSGPQATATVATTAVVTTVLLRSLVLGTHAVSQFCVYAQNFQLALTSSVVREFVMLTFQ